MSGDQVTHTPTPWTLSGEEDGDFMLWGAPADEFAFVGNVGTSAMALVGDKVAFDIDKANAEFIVLAVNSHDALTARVAELEAENERIEDLAEAIQELGEENERLRAENEQLLAAAKVVLTHRVGNLQKGTGYLRDNDESRMAIAMLSNAANLEPET